MPKTIPASAPWATRARLRWRTRTEDSRRELGYVLDVAITAGLVIAGLIMANSSLPSASKFALAILLGTFELVYLFARSISRQLQQILDDSLTVIPRDTLSRLLHDHLSKQRGQLLDRAEQLSEKSDCELMTHEMYGELLELTNVVAETRAGHATGSIFAISSTNIEDFEDEPLAEAYLKANRGAVARYVAVQRLFLIDQHQAKDKSVIALIQQHHDALTAPGKGTGSSGVKWLLKSEISFDDQTEDFALFANEALVTQAQAGRRIELSQDPVKIERAYRTFMRLWTLKNARDPSQLVKDRR